MKLPHRRQFLHLAAGAAALPAMSRIARAQAYPSRPVRVIVPFAPAGTTDILARLIGQWLTERLGQSFIIENRPGASTMIGTEAVVRSPADGYTLMVFGTASAINATLYENKYSADQIASLSKLSSSTINELVRFGLLDPRGSLFGFRDLASARQISKLFAHGIALSEIIRSVNEIREWLPEADSPTCASIPPLLTTSNCLVGD
jgi:Tripartite tricarboxylate transporter family receptor